MAKQGIRHDYDLHSNLCVPKDYACIICGTRLQGNTRWTDYFGEAVCMTCETPYQLLRPSGVSEEVNLPKCNIHKKWLPRLKEYWEETNQPMGLGIYLIERDYKEDLEHRKAWNKWCEARGYK